MGGADAGDHLQHIVAVWHADRVKNRQLPGGEGILAGGAVAKVEGAYAVAADRIHDKGDGGVGGQVKGDCGSAAHDGIWGDLQGQAIRSRRDGGGRVVGGVGGGVEVP